MRPIRVAQFGYGSLGKEIFQTLNENGQFKVVAVIDNDVSKAGKTLSTKSNGKIRILPDIDKLKSKPDILIHAATSSIDNSYLQFCSIAKKKIPIISTCEQLVYPTKNNQKTARKINSLAKRYGISILGVGVNPGFLMDSLVVTLSSVCTKITKIKVKRIVNVAKRRSSLQRKMGVGLSRREFKKNKIGHVGLAESASMICDALNIRTSSFFEKISPVIANKRLSSNGVVVKKGLVCGTKHILVAKNKGQKFLEMELVMSVGQDEYDLIEIQADPPVYIKTSGIMGDKATIALLLHYIPMLKSKPGFYTVNQMPLPTHFS